MKSLLTKILSLVLVAVGVGLVVSGCAGGSANKSSRATGLTLHIVWPERSATRVIPLSAQSLKVSVSAYEPDYAVPISETLVARPAGSGATSDITLSTMPALAKIRITMTAYPNADGTGVAQAVATQEMTTGDVGSSVNQDVSLDSTIDHVTASPVSVSTIVGGGASVSVTAFNADNQVVPTAPASWAWQSSAASTASVAASGNPVTVSGKVAGGASLTCTHSESGKKITINVTVTSSTGPPGCRFPGQLYGDSCGTDKNGTNLSWNCETGACEEPLVH
ncbi:hypothetical protein [Armatimonas sp.]|uniref:hypothetical protein n=1 Tax=Armatimonas sp. TaxID=1872638 RepID=UPI0037518BB0